jgi:hypothetical protein
MKTMQIAAITLIFMGVLGLIYDRFSYTEKTHDAKIGPLELQVREKETVNLPIWAGVGAIGVGVILLVVSKRR